MWRTLHHRGLISLTICLAAAGGMACCPVEMQDVLRGGIRSSLAPGTQTLTAMTESVRSSLPLLHVPDESFRPLEFSNSETASGQREIAPGSSETDRAMTARIRELEALVATFRERVQAAESQASLDVPTVREESLWDIVSVPAVVIGRERGDAEDVAARLIQTGSRVGIARNDLVMEPAIRDAFPNDPSDSSMLLLDRGQDVLAVDRPVACGRTLIGRVKSVGALVSTVELCTNRNFQVGAQLLRETPQGPVLGAIGVYAGTGERSGQLNLIAATEAVRVGDAVYTDAEVVGSSVRLFIGHVVRAEVEQGESHWRIDVVPEMTQVPSRVEVLVTNLNPERFDARRSDPSPNVGAAPRFEPRAAGVPADAASPFPVESSAKSSAESDLEPSVEPRPLMDPPERFERVPPADTIGVPETSEDLPSAELFIPEEPAP